MIRSSCCLLNLETPREAKCKLIFYEKYSHKSFSSFRNTTFTLGDNDYELGQRAQTERATSPARPFTAFQEKMRGYIKGCMEYSSGPAFRDDVRIF